MGLKQGEINLYVSDLDRAVVFYGAALGFEPVTGEDGPGAQAPAYRKVHRDGIVLTFFLAKNPGPAPATGMQPCMTMDLHVDDIQAVHRALEAAGADVSPINDWPGGRHCLFQDPDGIGWELLCP